MVGGKQVGLRQARIKDADLSFALGLPQQRLAFKSPLDWNLQVEFFQVTWTLKADCSQIVNVREGILQSYWKHLPLCFGKNPWVAFLGTGSL